MQKSLQILTPGAGSSPLHCVNGKQSVSGVDYFMAIETWKELPGYEYLFSVSDLGRVKRLPGIAIQRLRNGKRKDIIMKEKILKTWFTKLGYENIRLWHRGKSKTFLVSRLVLTVFRGAPKDKMQAMHLNHNPRDNRLLNLRWGTVSENIRMDWEDKRRTAYKHWTGIINENHPLSKPVDQYNLNGEFLKCWPNAEDIQRQIGIPSHSVRSCCRGNLKKTHGFIFKFS